MSKKLCKSDLSSANELCEKDGWRIFYLKQGTETGFWACYKSTKFVWFYKMRCSDATDSFVNWIVSVAQSAREDMLESLYDLNTRKGKKRWRTSSINQPVDRTDDCVFLMDKDMEGRRIVDGFAILEENSME